MCVCVSVCMRVVRLIMDAAVLIQIHNFNNKNNN